VSADLNFLWSGAAGAILVAIFTVVYTEFREARQAANERAGLARLLAHEVERNEGAVEVAQGGPEHGEGVKELVRVRTSTNLPSAEAWVEARARLAQLMARHDFAAIADYYAVVQGLGSPSGATRPYSVGAVEPGWKERTADVKNRLAKYAELPLPWRHLG
jgi:hypothetical protein